MTDKSKFSFLSLSAFFSIKKKNILKFFSFLLAELQYAFPLKPVRFTETESLPQLSCYSG